MKRILIVEDEEKVAKVLGRALEEEGYEVFCVDDGQAGLEAARTGQPDIILLDIMLPKMDGFEVCRSLKSHEKYQAIPIIMMTGLTDTESTVKGLTSGADDYVSKPFHMPELLARLKSHLKMKELYDIVKTEEEEKSALLEVSQSFSSTITPHDTLFNIVSKIAEVMDVKRCSIIYVNPHEKDAYVMASHDCKEIDRLKLDLGKYPEIQKVIETGEQVIINDVYNDPILFSVREALSLIDIKSIMAFPIAFKDTLIGTLILRTSRRESTFNEREIRFCDLISHLVAMPLKNAYLFQNLHKEREQERNGRLMAEAEKKASSELLEIICRAQSEFILKLDPEITFDNLLKTFVNFTNSEYGVISEVIYASDGRPYIKSYIISDIIQEDEYKKFHKKYARAGLEFHNMKSLFGAIITTGKPVISNDPANDPRRGGLPKGHPPLNSFLGLPFFRGEEMVGIVALANRPGGYKEELAEYLRPFLATCANIMEAYRNEKRRKEAEEALQKTRENLAKAQEIANLGSWDWNIHTGEILWSDQACRHFGFKPGEVSPSYDMFLNLIHPDDLGFLKNSIKEAINGVKPYDVEFRIIRKDGTGGVIHSMGEVFFDDDGKPARMMGVDLDITRHKRIEVELEKSLSLLQATLDSTADGILVVDREGKWTSFNKKFQEMWRIPNAIMDSKDDKKALEFVLTQLKDPEAFLAKVKELYNSQDAISFDVIEFKDERIFERYSQPQRVGEEILGRVWSFRDITERERSKDELERAFQELKVKTADLEKFHEVSVGRELVMIKLKDEVNALLEKIGQPRKY